MILHHTVKIKFLKIFILISETLSPSKLDDQRRIIMNVNSMLQKRNIKQTWRTVSVQFFNIITKNRKVENTVRKIIHDDVVHVLSGDMTNMFNDYFVDIKINIAESIGGNGVNPVDYMTHINQPNYFFLQTNSLLFLRKINLLSEK